MKKLLFIITFSIIFLFQSDAQNDKIHCQLVFFDTMRNVGYIRTEGGRVLYFDITNLINEYGILIPKKESYVDISSWAIAKGGERVRKYYYLEFNSDYILFNKPLNDADNQTVANSNTPSRN